MKRKSMAQLKLVAGPGKHNIVMSREFDAPREFVFKAFTDGARKQAQAAASGKNVVSMGANISQQYLKAGKNAGSRNAYRDASQVPCLQMT